LAGQQFNEAWEIIIVDDGSPSPVDQAVITRLFGNSTQPVVQLLRQDNAGPASARNSGVSNANGLLVAFTDDDCQPNPTWLRDLVQCWRENPQALIGGTTINGLTDNSYSSTSQLIVDLVYRRFNSDPTDSYFLASNNILCSRSQYLELGGFDPTFPRAGAEDRDFCDRWRTKNWPIVWNQEAMIHHYHNLTLESYVNLHLRYGRGAYIYQQKRRHRQSGSMRDDVSFHIALLKRIRPAAYAKYGLRTAINLLIWQAANAIGFALEAKAQRENRRLGKTDGD
jgi:glycosyltransferase involved in cell wall biosynthesis